MKKTILLAAAVAAMSGLIVLAQDAPREGREGRGDRGARGPGRPGGEVGAERGPGGREFNPEQMRDRMRQFMTTRVKEQLKVTDDEWAVIEPLVTRVNELRRLTRAGGPQFGRGQPPAAAEGAEVPPVRTASDALRQAAEAEGTASETIKARLDEFRTARTAAEAELKKAQDELRAVLTVRQEAQLTLSGVLD